MLDEVLRDLEEAPAAGQGEGSLLRLLSLGVDVGPVVHQQGDHVLVALPGSLHQGSVAGGGGGGGGGDGLRMTTVEPLYCGHLGELVKCPV